MLVRRSLPRASSFCRLLSAAAARIARMSGAEAMTVLFRQHQKTKV